jgi:(4S)-4-hydroxy-5-phosphonooxypentane-2,3-dione isomerase
LKEQPLSIPKPLQALVVEFRIKASHIDKFAIAIGENARLSRELEPGCKQFDVCRAPSDASLFFLYELYDDEAAIQAHLRAPHFLTMDQTTRDWVETKKVWRYERVEPCA